MPARGAEFAGPAENDGPQNNNTGKLQDQENDGRNRKTVYGSKDNIIADDLNASLHSTFRVTVTECYFTSLIYYWKVQTVKCPGLYDQLPNEQAGRRQRSPLRSMRWRPLVNHLTLNLQFRGELRVIGVNQNSKTNVC